MALKGGVLLGRPAEKAPEVFRIPQIGAWQKLLQAGCAQAMEQEACQLLDKLTANNQLNSQTLRYFYQDFMQMLFSLPEKKRQDDMFREPEALELYRNGMKTVPDMKALVHYVALVWDSETEENSQSTVEIIMAYIAEHLENELRREELAEAVHLNPDYMARLFKKETGMNLKDYIIQQKMQEAQSLLCTTNLPISLIAQRLGIRISGISPLLIRSSITRPHRRSAAQHYREKQGWLAGHFTADRCCSRSSSACWLRGAGGIGGRKWNRAHGYSADAGPIG